MSESRRTPNTGSGPRGRSGPGRPAVPRRARASPASVTSQAADGRRPPIRLTGRAAVLVLVLAVLTVSYASSLRAYLQQRADIGALKEQIAERSTSIDDLEREKRRWQDPAFVRAQARERFGYLMPGETAFVVLDEDGRPLEPESELSDPSTVGDQTPEAFWVDTWDSIELAGHPADPPPPPAREIDGSVPRSGQ